MPQLSELKSLDSYSIIKEEIAENIFELGREWHRLADKLQTPLKSNKI